MRGPARVSWALCALGLPLCPGCGLLCTVVAPIFEHGYGRAIYTFRSYHLEEEDVIEVVRQELEAAGYQGIQVAPDCPAWRADKRVLLEGLSEARTEVLVGETVVSALDVCVPAQGFGMEIVTWDDDARVTLKGGPHFGSSIESATQDTAWYLRGQISSSMVVGVPTVGLLYDPLPSDTGAYEGEEAYEHSRDQIRMQAQDLIAWMEDRRKGG